MTISQYMDEAASSLGKISKHVKVIRKHRRNKSERKEFLNAFEKDFLDSVHKVVSARNINGEEVEALNKIKIVHYNSARLCLEDIVKRKATTWRKFRGNRDLFIDDTIAQDKFEMYVGMWNSAIDMLRKTRAYINDDKIKHAGCFDAFIDELSQVFSHVDELLSKSIPQRLMRSGLSCCKYFFTAILLPISILVIAYIINRYVQGPERQKEAAAYNTAEEHGGDVRQDDAKGLLSNSETNKVAAVELGAE